MVSPRAGTWHQAISGGRLVLDGDKYKWVALRYCTGRQRFTRALLTNSHPPFPRERFLWFTNWCMVYTCINIFTQLSFLTLYPVFCLVIHEVLYCTYTSAVARCLVRILFTKRKYICLAVWPCLSLWCVKSDSYVCMCTVATTLYYIPWLIMVCSLSLWWLVGRVVHLYLLCNYSHVLPTTLSCRIHIMLLVHLC